MSLDEDDQKHQKRAYKIIKDDDEITGKCIVATRDIEKGQLIFEEMQLFHFNMNDNEDPNMSQCVTCGIGIAPIEEHKPVKKSMTSYITKSVSKKLDDGTRTRCFMCSWPVCSSNCEMVGLHSMYECNVLLENDIHYPEDTRQGRDMASICRAFSLRCQNSLKWNEILDIMPITTLDEYGTSNESKEILDNLEKYGKSVTPIKSYYPNFKYEYEPIIKEEISAQLTILGRRVGFFKADKEQSFIKEFVIKTLVGINRIKMI